MAEIPIQRKEGHSLWWLWLLILIIVLAVAWWLWASRVAPTTTPVDSTAVTAPVAAPPATDSAAARGATTAPRPDSAAPR